MTESSHAVFLSYASQDAQAAQKICQALRAAGIEVWFDQSELRGGDAWDHSIRRQIKNCALFIPVISRNTHDRDEGYFRLEWKLAVDRSDLMSANRTFLLPVVIDETRDDDEQVPDRFRDVQWTRLPRGETPSAFVERVARLLVPTNAASAPRHDAAGPLSAGTPKKMLARTSWSKRGLPVIAAALILGAAIYLVMDEPWTSKPSVPSSTVAVKAVSPPFTPPPHSIAVLPFVNLSGDKDQEYFSEGLTEEILNSLTEINGLQVSGRTSAFSFEGKDTDVGTIARKLNVGAILEGSVRRSGHTIRVTAQLMNAVTGFEVWSQSYDRDLGDVLQLQTEIATAVADALKVTLLGDVSAKIELGGTRNPAAFDAYLRASSSFHALHEEKELPTAIAEYTEAIHLDPNYALAFADRSLARAEYAGLGATGAAVREGFKEAEADARRAITLAPELAEAHRALAFVSAAVFHFAQANAEFARALALAPGNAEILGMSAGFTAYMGHFDAGIAAGRRAVALDPLDYLTYQGLGNALFGARRYREAVTVFTESISVDPNYDTGYGELGLALYAAGDLRSALASCEAHRDNFQSQVCLAMVYDKLGRHADAQAELTKIETAYGDDAAYQCAQVYAQWGDRGKALERLDAAMRVRDSGLIGLRADPLLSSLHREPRFQAIERELKFPP
ncbi:MAG TPA: TIR domain-containing protein [Steroidobacteraceae bacterium]|nr:TIR domain-containing protein [Steroidobacteraceae bacterium]